MNSEQHNHLREIFKSIPPLADYQPEHFKIIALGGYSNENYRLKNDNLDVILRIPGVKTKNYINRIAEKQHRETAVKLGISPVCLWHNNQGYSLTQTIQGGRTLSCSDLREPNIIDRLLLTVRLLHNTQHQFVGQVDPFASINTYFDLLQDVQKIKFQQRLAKTRSFFKKQHSLPQKFVASHNDLNKKNLLIDNHQKIWFIDWEYSSMASPYWDLATICNTGEYQHANCNDLLDRYSSQHNVLSLEILDGYRQALSLLNDCWMELFIKTSSF